MVLSEKQSTGAVFNFKHDVYGETVKEVKKMNKRATALEIIRIEYAKYGKETRESMRAYVENRISAEARNEAVKRGLRIFEGRL